MFSLKVALAFAILGLSHCAFDFLETCQRNDPRLNECIVEKSTIVLPRILNGVPELKFPTLLPLNIPSVTIETEGNLKLAVNNINVYGLDTAKLSYANVDLENQKALVTLTFDYLNTVGQYEINGKILVISLDGSGPVNSTMFNITTNMNVAWDYQTIKGIKYINIIKLTTKFVGEGAHFELGNLFNGEKILGEATNRFLNENWMELHKTFEPAISKSSGEILKKLLNKIATRIPFDVILPL